MKKRIKNSVTLHAALRPLLTRTWRLIALGLVFAACNQDRYDVDYAPGYPDAMAGNWRAFEFQGGAYDLNRLSDEYDLVTALDPNSKDSVVVDNLYNSGVRVKVSRIQSSLFVSHGRQLEVISMGQYGIHTVSLNGEYLNTEEDGEYLTMQVGLYDQYTSLVDTLLIIAFRKTGFEDVDYQSLLNK